MRKVFALLALGLIVGCSSGSQPRMDPFADVQVEPKANAVSFDVVVPKSLTVSEANLYKPVSDIVWREDPLGDRHEQVKVIVEAAMERGLRPFNKGRKIAVTVEIQEFHALTERARYSVGGTHAIKLMMVVWDATTGSPLIEPRFVDASFIALGGQDALDAEAKGITQKRRITAHLAGVIQRELFAAGFGQLRTAN